MAEARSAAGDASEHDADDNGGYEREAMAVLEAMALNTRAVLILNTANRSSLPFLDARAVVEVPAVVGRAGPGAAGRRRGARARARARRADEGRRAHDDRRGADRLVARSPSRRSRCTRSCPSVATAREIFDGYRARLPALAEAFPA